MRQAKTAKELVNDPIDRYLTGPSFVIWAQRAERIGMFHTAPRVDRADQLVLMEAAPLTASPYLAPRYDLLHDAAAIDQFDESGFTFFEAFLARSRDVIATRVRRLAVVRPHGIAGAAFAGLFQKWVVSKFDARLCTMRSEAYEFLAISADDRAEVEAIAGARIPTLRSLRDYLTANVTDAAIQNAADALGIAVRSLQRTLADLGTSFRDELALVRIHLAENRLIDSDDKVETIASELGFGSAPSFVRMFERVNGCPPGEYRRRVRNGYPA